MVSLPPGQEAGQQLASTDQLSDRTWPGQGWAEPSEEAGPSTWFAEPADVEPEGTSQHTDLVPETGQEPAHLPEQDTADREAQAQAQLHQADTHVAALQEQLSAEQAANRDLQQRLSRTQQQLNSLDAQHSAAVAVHRDAQQQLHHAETEFGSLGERLTIESAPSRQDDEALEACGRLLAALKVTTPDTAVPEWTVLHLTDVHTL